MEEKLGNVIQAATILKEILEEKPSHVSALRGAEDCNDSYQEYLEWSYEYEDYKDILIRAMADLLKIC